MIQNHTPFEKLFNKKPNYSNLRSFGCLAMASNPERTTDKFAAKGVPCIFLGYPNSQKGHKLLNLINNRCFVTRDVKFHEHIFPCNKAATSHYYHPTPVHMEPQPTAPHPAPGSYDDIPLEWEEEPETHPPSLEPELEDQTCIMRDALTNVLPQPRRSTRSHKPPEWLTNYVTHTKTDPAVVSNVATTYVQPSFHAFLAQILETPDPKHFKVVVQQQKWVNVMNAEIQALETNHSRTITNLPARKRAIGCKWLYKTKFNLMAL